MAQPLPNTAVAIADLVKLWPEVMPPLKDQGEADRMNQLLGNLLTRLAKSNKVVPDMVFVTDSPPGTDRAKVLIGEETIDPVFFRLAYGRWARSPMFERFWDSLTPDEQKQFYQQVPWS